MFWRLQDYIGTFTHQHGARSEDFPLKKGKKHIKVNELVLDINLYMRITSTVNK